MCDFKPGDEVVCIDAQGVTFESLVEGQTYTVSSVGLPVRDANGKRAPTVRLLGAPDPFGQTRYWPCGTPYRWEGYSAWRFRKVERRTDKLNLTEWLSQPSGDTDKLDKTRAPAKRRERT